MVRLGMGFIEKCSSNISEIETRFHECCFDKSRSWAVVAPSEEIPGLNNLMQK